MLVTTHNKRWLIKEIVLTLSLYFTLFNLIFLSACKKFIEVAPPITSSTESVIYEDDNFAASVLTGMYYDMSRSNIPTGGLTSLSLFPGLSSDEFSLFVLTNSAHVSFFKNELSNMVSSTSDFWSKIYPYVYISNSAIEGLARSQNLTPIVRQQLIGEAKFMRAFCYFYLVNLYGNVPLITKTEYEDNSLLPRSEKAEVYKQMIEDLKEAANILTDGYVKADGKTKYTNGTEERVRPNKWAAYALLSRVYLYNNDWANAELQSSAVINNNSLYSILPLKDVFLKNSREAIWQLQPVFTGLQSNTREGAMFILNSSSRPSASTRPVFISSNLLNSFEFNDKRAELGNWVNKFTSGSTTYYYPYKYKVGLVNSTTQEYTMVMRLAEQYLIRAEARAQLGKLSESISDLDFIRSRAGLPRIADTNPGIKKEDLLKTILRERQVELFAEWGHRWFDLKRTGSVDSVMAPITIKKGGIWQNTDQLYPIRLQELERNSQLHQNPGY